jgi:hypothetical protein
MGKLDGKAALVSASGRGNRCAVAQKLAAVGERVVINDPAHAGAREQPQPAQ